MIEILPNWHPIFVHFTIALFTASVLFYLLSYLFPLSKRISKIRVSEFEIVARWCLWLTAVITIATVIAGFYAYNTVKHDAVSHIAMIEHRNWAILSAVGIILMACWSVWRHLKNKANTLVFIIALLIVQGLLISTAWHGGELVYRYGLGVMSLPHQEEIAQPAHKHQI